MKTPTRRNQSTIAAKAWWKSSNNKNGNMYSIPRCSWPGRTQQQQHSNDNCNPEPNNAGSRTRHPSPASTSLQQALKAYLNRPSWYSTSHLLLARLDARSPLQPWGSSWALRRLSSCLSLLLARPRWLRLDSFPEGPSCWLRKLHNNFPPMSNHLNYQI